MTINEQLKHARKFRRMTTTELAKRAGTSVTYISRLEHDKLSPSSKMIEKLAEGLDMKVLVLPLEI